MKDKARGALQKKGYIILILLIIGAGIFLRSWHFSDWLHFELDQSRDANVIGKAIEGGVGELPLLGPRASGTYLRLGPVYYYFSYASAKIFGNDPPAIAGAVLFFSILSIPLFFQLSRRYFSKKISAILLLVFSLSLFLIMYGRFAWNPNPLVFFMLLFFYSVLRMVDRNERRRGLWMIMAALSLAVATQLHFLAFVTVPLVFLIFMIIKRPKIKLRFWVTSIFVILFFYLPMIVNEINTNGANTKEFISAVAGKADKNPNSLAKSIFLDFSTHANSYLLIVSSQDDSNFGKVIVKKNPDPFCQGECLDYSFGIFGALFLIFGVLILVWKIKNEKEEKRRDFLILGGLIFAVTLLLFIPLAAALSPRFFLVSFMVPIIFLGIILEYLDRGDKKFQGVFFLAVVFLIISNLKADVERLSELRAAPSRMIYTPEDKILKDKTRVTYEQENMVKDYIKETAGKNNLPVYFFSDTRYLTSFEYLFENDKIDYSRLSNSQIFGRGNFFYITFSDSVNKFDIGKYAKKYDIDDSRDFGTLTILSLTPKEEFITADSEDREEIKKEKRKDTPKRYKWDEIFSEADGETGN